MGLGEPKGKQLSECGLKKDIQMSHSLHPSYLFELCLLGGSLIICLSHNKHVWESIKF